MILVYAATAAEADRYARARGLRGAHCFGDAGVALAGVRFLPHDEIWILPSAAPQVVEAVHRRLDTFDEKPTVHVVGPGRDSNPR